MPRATTLTPVILAEIARRRRAGETWKAIGRDLRDRGVSADRSHLWRMWQQHRDVAQRLSRCATPADKGTA